MLLKISSISNLTDARFFSAIGAHYLGFCFDVLHPQNIPIEKANEIIKWLHHPVLVGEFGQHQTKEEIEFIANKIGLNDIQIPFNHPQKMDFHFDKFLMITDANLIKDKVEFSDSDFIVLKIDETRIQNIFSENKNVSSLPSPEITQLKQFISQHHVFIDTVFTKENILPVVETLQPYGIQITCQTEQKSGISNVDEYAEIVELVGF